MRSKDVARGVALVAVYALSGWLLGGTGGDGAAVRQLLLSAVVVGVTVMLSAVGLVFPESRPLAVAALVGLLAFVACWALGRNRVQATARSAVRISAAVG